jgi:hypothetical protein
MTPTLKVPQEAQHLNRQEILPTQLREGLKSKPNKHKPNKSNSLREGLNLILKKNTIYQLNLAILLNLDPTHCYDPTSQGYNRLKVVFFSFRLCQFHRMSQLLFHHLFHTSFRFHSKSMSPFHPMTFPLPYLVSNTRN